MKVVLGILLMTGYGYAISHPCKPVASFTKKPLEIKEGHDRTARSTSRLYLTLSYDFGDSVTICCGGKKLFSGMLYYQVPDSNLSSFPYNRATIVISQPVVHRNCLIRFWQHRQYISFRLKRQTSFVNLEIHKDSKRWRLFTSGVSPWPE